MITRAIRFREIDGDFLVPGEPASTSAYAETCVRNVMEGEYNYERTAVETVRSLVDVGCNLGSFSLWASRVWWPLQIESIHAYDPNFEAVSIARLNTRGLPISFHDAAVTEKRFALFRCAEDWGGSRTCGETAGEPVRVVHPRDLPAADCLKVDAEGVDPEVLAHYQHMATVLVCMFEYHEERDREPMEKVCMGAGLTQVRHHGSPPRQGIQIWVRK